MGYFRTCTNVTVASSGGVNGTVQFNIGTTPSYLPQSYTIAGPGYNNLGALRWTQGNTGANAFNRNITVQSDATCYIGSSLTVEYSGTLSGSGALTLFGGGLLKIMNGAATHDGMIVVSNGTLSVAGALPSVTNITILAGGTLNGSQAHFLGAEVVNNGGTWNDIDTASTWSGLGDGTNWSDAANWYGNVPTNIEASIPAAVSTRTIEVDVPSQVSKLTWPGAANDNIKLLADLTVDEMLSSSAASLNINGKTLYVGYNAAGGYNTPKFSGTGRIVKQGTSTFFMGPSNNTHPFSGSIVVSNGVALQNDYYGYFQNATNLVAGANGTYQFSLGAQPHIAPLRYTIAGTGYNNLGALRCLGTIGLTRPITVQSDATTFINTGVTLTHSGALGGSGVMTLTGGGTYTMNNAWTYTVNLATGNGIVASTGTVNIAGCTLTITGLETATANEYVLVNHSSTSGNLEGSSFAATNGLTGEWLIDYDGTAANPAAVVLVLPPPKGTVFILE